MTAESTVVSGVDLLPVVLANGVVEGVVSRRRGWLLADAKVSLEVGCSNILD